MLEVEMEKVEMKSKVGNDRDRQNVKEKEFYKCLNLIGNCRFSSFL